ncbi:MAG: hypothetical protein ACRC7G_07940 [Beijerinckiaceae bacterium]
MKPVEALDTVSLAGNRAKPNDDAQGIAGNRVWVIDGATSLGPPLLPGQSDAAWLAREANRLFHRHADTVETSGMIGAVIEGLKSAFAVQARAMPEFNWQAPIAAFLMLTFHADHVEAVWQGDCRALLRLGDRIVACGETAEGEAEERRFAARLGADQGGAAMLRSDSVVARLREARMAVNTPSGRWLLGLAPEAAAHLEVARFPLEGPAEALLMTDGFSALELKYGRRDAAGMLADARRLGLAELGAELRRIEEIEDPDGRLWPRFKRSDDATAALVSFG